MDRSTYERVCKHFLRLAEMSLDEREAEIAAIRNEDEAVADEVERMLVSDQSAQNGDFLGSVSDTEGFRHESDTTLMGDSLEGKRLRHYQIEERIGEGGMGVVYRAYDPHGDRHVAIKIVREGMLSSNEQLNRFRVEAKAAAQLQHPGIVPVYEIGCDGDNEFFSMALISGSDLRAVIRDTERLNQRTAAAMCRDIARALDYAHSQGIVHRDVKPANILVDTDGRPILTDFGLAKRLTDAADQTSTGEIMGTVVYAAPEQLGDAKHAGTAADIYGLGASLYECLTGVPPYAKCDDLVELMSRKRDESPAPPQSIHPNIDDDIQTICMRCLQRDPVDRYPSAGQLADDLERYLRGDPVSRLPRLRAIQRAIDFRRERQEYLSAGAAWWLLPIHALVHPVIWVLVEKERSPIWLWCVLGIWAIASMASNYYYHWRQYWRLSLTERQSGILTLALNIAFACLFVIHGPLSTDQPISRFLAVYPPICLVVGVVLCAHAGRWILWAIPFFVLSLVIDWQLSLGPLIFGIVSVMIALVIDRDLRRANKAESVESR